MPLKVVTFHRSYLEVSGIFIYTPHKIKYLDGNDERDGSDWDGRIGGFKSQGGESIEQYSRGHGFRKYVSIIIGMFLMTSIFIILPDVKGNTNYDEPFYFNSPHPYTNNYARTYYIMKPNAISYQIHFSRINTESNCDFIKLYDASNNLIQSISGGYPNGFTSNTITTYRVKVQFTSDSSVTDWGYCIDKIIYTTSDTFQSPHDYPNNYDNSWTIQAPQPSFATRIHIVFSRADLNSGDSIKIYDFGGTLIKTIMGYHTYGYDAGIINGWGVRVRLVTDGSATAWGFQVGSVTYTTTDEEQACEFATLAVGNYESQKNLDNGDANLMSSNLILNGWVSNRDLRDGNVLKNTFYDSDDSDFIYYTGHGTTGKCCLFRYGTGWETDVGKKEFTHSDADSFAIGSLDCEWMILAACNIMKDSTSNLKHFVNHGVHSVWGYRDVSYDKPTDNNVALFFLCETIAKNRDIEYAFIAANMASNYKCSTSIFHQSSICDHMWGHGMVFSDPVNNNDVYKATY